MDIIPHTFPANSNRQRTKNLRQYKFFIWQEIPAKAVFKKSPLSTVRLGYLRRRKGRGLKSFPLVQHRDVSGCPCRMLKSE